MSSASWSWVGPYTDAFELVQFYIMASEADTIVTLPDRSTRTIGIGESLTITVIEADKITSDKPVQVDLITGDKDSEYEHRWYSLRPTSDWSTSYIAPMGDTEAATRIVLFNPNGALLSVRVDYRNVEGQKKNYRIDVPAGQSKFTAVIPTSSAA